MLCTKQGE